MCVLLTLTTTLGINSEVRYGSLLSRLPLSVGRGDNDLSPKVGVVIALLLVVVAQIRRPGFYEAGRGVISSTRETL